MALELSRIRAVACDMDGVLWLGDEPLPGLHAFFNLLHRRALPYVLATNNSSKTPADYVAKLSHMGVNGVSDSNIITSGTATLHVLAERYPPGTHINMVGGIGLRHLLEEAGYILVNQNAQAVVVGLDAGLTYEKLKYATFCIRDGAAFIATNDDNSIPTPDGFAPGAGSIVAALRASSEREPLVIGKPHLPMFQQALQLMGTAPEQTLMIGDRLETDIIGAAQAGMKTALLLTGVTDGDRLKRGDAAPDAIFDDLAQLVAAWEAS
ncbi:MAG: HAD-IIA family hydrolase [Anaerolineae bacterium]|nr:HAD-IIA family hydrolase [Anaerolineae bacterium]NUQ03556.1 HAD-IIA family hydrolase [Anaerolineae bacterium]